MSVLCVAVGVFGVTQLHDVIIVVCFGSGIMRFNATTYQRLTNINGQRDHYSCAVAACEQTSHVYIAYHWCIWRVSADGGDVRKWPLESRHTRGTFKPWTLSVTSTRLLVTSCYTKQLMQFDADGNELRRVHLPDYMKPYHAVESPTGTFIVSHRNTQLKQGQVSEVNTGGEVLRQFPGSRLPSLNEPQHVAVDSHGNVFVVDSSNCHILLLDARLTLRRVIIDEHQLIYEEPQCLCYREQSGQLLVGFASNRSVLVFDVVN